MRAKRLWLSLALGAGLLAAPAIAQDYAIIGANLYGDKVGEGRGKEGASADFNGEADFKAGRMCFYLEVFGLEGASGVAIHKGKDGVDGEEVLSLGIPKDRNDEVCAKADAATLREIVKNAKNYYLLVNHPDFADGAIRGQMAEDR